MFLIIAMIFCFALGGFCFWLYLFQKYHRCPECGAWDSEVEYSEEVLNGLRYRHKWRVCSYCPACLWQKTWYTPTVEDEQAWDDFKERHLPSASKEPTVRK